MELRGEGGRVGWVELCLDVPTARQPRAVSFDQAGDGVEGCIGVGAQLLVAELEEPHAAEALAIAFDQRLDAAYLLDDLLLRR